MSAVLLNLKKFKLSKYCNQDCGQDIDYFIVRNTLVVLWIS